MVILESNQIQAWDAFTVSSQQIRSFDLMKKAAKTCVDWISANLSSLDQFYIFCGKGNNGGDGLLIANGLSEMGLSVDVFILEYGKIGSPDFQEALQHSHDQKINLHYISSQEAIPKIPKDVCVIDALFGIGLNRPLDDLAAEIVQQINVSNAVVVSIDLPSGMYADTINQSNLSIRAHHTLSFGCHKLAFLHASAESKIGQLAILDIGLETSFLETIVCKYRFVDAQLAKEIYKPRTAFSHKGHYGHALLVAGSESMPGAGVIAANSCVRTGTGKTDWWSPLMKTVPNTILPEVMLPSEVLSKNERYSAIAIGPGLGMADNSKNLLMELLSFQWNRMILDADALNIISSKPELLKMVSKEAILTPHPKEFERLVVALGISAPTPWAQLKELARISGCIVVLKGRYSMIASPEGNTYINTTGNPGLAKGGSGDALTGILLGLLSQPSYQPFEAAILGVYLHGKAADLALESQSQESLIASDLANYIGKAFKEFA
ncbi:MULTISPECIES: NAD(P)H-hydrate dehydratase [unclassified Paraflavitalea]|uniref:NAD(P)H-hydrate dehydratase n=1 Tax=unclassified Paraflavitalea TaxID=2798305 RepID=UPI003D349F75